METTAFLLHTKANIFCFPGLNKNPPSLRHFNRHLQVHHTAKHNFGEILKAHPECFLSANPISAFPVSVIFQNPNRIKCSNYNTLSSESDNTLLKPLQSISFASLLAYLSQLTPFDVCKWSAIVFVSTAIAKKTVKTLLSPFFWMYFSWTWLFWPWFVAITLAIYGLYSFSKHLRSKASVVEQIAIVTSVFTWLTLVPPAYFSGFIEGWPFVFFSVYHYFFFLNVTIRKRLYGDYYARPHDLKWDVKLPNWCRFLFCSGVMIGHWLAAFEGPELHLIPGGWTNLWIWVLIAITIFAQYKSTLYLANYSEKIVVPTAVVQFGPFRWVRHPIYASIVLLFVTYCVALRAPFSALIMVAICLTYYEQKAKVEETLMLETFGADYREYMNKVKYKFIPFVY